MNMILVTLIFMISSSLMIIAASAGNFYKDFDITWGDRRAKIFNGGQLLTLSLDKASGSGFQSKNEYLFGRIDMQLKLVAGNSAGTVTAYYVSSNVHCISIHLTKYMYMPPTNESFANCIWMAAVIFTRTKP